MSFCHISKDYQISRRYLIMKNKKFLKKLSAVIIGFCLGVSSMASVGAISPIRLWKKISTYDNQNTILQDYDKDIKKDLLENDFSVLEVDEAKKNILSGRICEFRRYMLKKLMAANEKAADLREKIIERVALITEKSTLTCLNGLKSYSHHDEIGQKINDIEALVKECEKFSNEISKNNNLSIKILQDYKSKINENFNKMKQLLFEASKRIEELKNNDAFKKSQSQQPSSQNAQAKSKLQSRFENLKSGHQIISGPCWLYAAQTAINEFRDRTNSGQIIKRNPDDNRIYSDVELEYLKKFENPFGLNPNKINGKTAYDILDYIHANGIEARRVVAYRHAYLRFFQDNLFSFVENLIREHFKNHTSPILVYRKVGNVWHEEAIAGVVEDEFLTVNSASDSLDWRPVGRLSEYLNSKNFFEAIFLGNARTAQSVDKELLLVPIPNIKNFNKAKDNLLKFARDDFNMKSLI